MNITLLEGFGNNTIIIKHMQALEMRLNRLKCQEAQGQFLYFWDKGSLNLELITTQNTIHPNIICHIVVLCQYYFCLSDDMTASARVKCIGIPAVWPA